MLVTPQDVTKFTPRLSPRAEQCEGTRLVLRIGPRSSVAPPSRSKVALISRSVSCRPFMNSVSPGRMTAARCLSTMGSATWLWSRTRRWCVPRKRFAKDAVPGCVLESVPEGRAGGVSPLSGQRGPRNRGLTPPARPGPAPSGTDSFAQERRYLRARRTVFRLIDDAP